MSRRRAREPEPPPELIEPAGVLICGGFIPGRAVPWKAPRIGKNGGTVQGRDYLRYKAWQQEVNLRARLLMRRKRPYGGPVILGITFRLRPGVHHRGTPDVTNLCKAFEDALQGAAFVNDTQVQRIDGLRILSVEEPEGVQFEVWSA
jgi:Holliday junction resolvase RusA-like endonuclease